MRACNLAGKVSLFSKETFSASSVQLFCNPDCLMMCFSGLTKQKVHVLLASGTRVLIFEKYFVLIFIFRVLLNPSK